MAVYKKTYSRWEGAPTPEWSRFWVLTRYAFEEMRSKRTLTLILLGSSILPLVFAVVIYLHHNLSAIKLLEINVNKLVTINQRFFLEFLGVQSMFAFFLTAFVGPGLVSPDVTNNGLPLYLARPFSRVEYVLGKLAALVVLLSAVTWIPGMALVLLQGYLEPGWMAENWRIPFGLVAGAMVWILLISFLALALSAWVKWKPVAGALLFGTFFVMGAFGGAINEVMRTRWGNLLNISHLIGSVWVNLFDQPMQRGAGGAFFRVMPRTEIPIWCCWMALAAIAAACLWMLARKVRGFEVVR
jgi:ABC-2 type transport system permease protein